MSRTFRYAANRIPEIADTIVEIDNAIKWGFGWEIGVFETWDAIGVPESVERMRQEGQAVPANVEKMLATGATTFYKSENGDTSFYDLVAGEYKPVPERPGVIDPQRCKGTHRHDQNKSRSVAHRSSATAWRVSSSIQR